MNTRMFLLLSVLGAMIAIGGQTALAGDPSVASLVDTLSSGNDSARIHAIDELGVLGPEAAEAVAPLSQLLTNESARVRAHAASALGDIGPAAKSAVPALAKLLGDPNETVRRQAIRALGLIRPGPKVMVPLCVKLLEDTDAGVRVRVLSSIAEMGPEAVPGLIEALKNDKAVYAACLVLRAIGPEAKAAVPALTAKLDDPRPEVRREAILALASMNDAAAPAAMKIAKALGDEPTQAAATYALGRIGVLPDGSKALVEAHANGNNKMLSTISLWTLARCEPDNKELRREATKRLIAGLKDADPFVRATAARALASLPPMPEVTAPIWEQTLRDCDETTIRHALDALAALGPTAVPRLVEALKHEPLRAEVVYILGRMGPAAAPAVPELVKLLSDKNERVVHEAVLALANIGPAAKEAVGPLTAALKQPNNPSAPAMAFALGKIGPAAVAAVPVLTKMLNNSNRHLALASAWALVHIRPTAAVAKETLPILKAGLIDESPLARRGAAEGLGRLGRSAAEATTALEQATRDKDPAVRHAAADALRAVRGR